MTTTAASLRSAEHGRASHRPASRGDAPHRTLPTYAIAMTDVDRLWRTPAGSALVESALDGQAPEDAAVVSAQGTEAVVLSGPPSRIAALVAGLLEQGARVYEKTDAVPGDARAKWVPVRTAPPVPEDADDDGPAALDDDLPRIDGEFAALCGMQTPAERASLRASIAEHGCRDPLVVWEERDLLLDGHNRLADCRELDASFETVEDSIPDRTAARNWIIDNALARRSLSPAQRRYLRGKRHLAERKPAGRPPKGLPHVEGVSGETAQLIAEREGVSRATIERDAEFARALDALGTKARAAILAGDVKLSRPQLARAAEQHARTPDDLRALKDAGDPDAPDVLARLDALASRVSRLVEEALADVLLPADRARLANVWALGAAVERLAAALPAEAASEGASDG